MADPQPAKPKNKSSSKLPLILIGCGCGGLVLLAIVSAVAIPAFINYVRRSKTAEARFQLRALYDGAAAYYEEQGMPPSLPRTPAAPPCGKKALWPAGASPAWAELGFEPADPLYYAYEIESDPAAEVLTFRAVGDLDCDGAHSTFELTAGVDESGQLYRSPGIYTAKELE